MARYYRTDTASNLPVSTEITGYAVSALVYLHSLDRDQRYLDAARAGARYLAAAWDPAAGAMPFETDPAAFTYFFDCGIIARSLLAVWRATGEDEFRESAAAVGRAMARDFADGQGGFHPILALPGKQPLPRDPARWSRSAGCYQLKAAMAWWDLWEATGDAAFCEPYERTLACALSTWRTFLPGHPDPLKVVDRLHAFAYFLEGLLPRLDDQRCAAALAEGIGLLSGYRNEHAPCFERADVLAQLLRIRLFAGSNGAPLDREAAAAEAAVLEGFQVSSTGPRTDGGFYFGRQGGAWMPHVSPVSTAFALQALALWHGGGAARTHRHVLI